LQSIAIPTADPQIAVAEITPALLTVIDHAVPFGCAGSAARPVPAVRRARA
jgi:hypothetical protein